MGRLLKEKLGSDLVWMSIKWLHFLQNCKSKTLKATIAFAERETQFHFAPPVLDLSCKELQIFIRTLKTAFLFTVKNTDEFSFDSHRAVKREIPEHRLAAMNLWDAHNVWPLLSTDPEDMLHSRWSSGAEAYVFHYTWRKSELHRHVT